MNREGEAGELAVVYDRQDRFMAVGFWDPDSPMPLRIVHQGSPARIDREWWLKRALACRERRADLAQAGTTGYRCINGDSEGFPGLVADLYAETLVVKIYSAAWLARWEEIEGVLREVFAPRFLVRRVARNVAAEEGFRGDAGDEVVVFEENGLKFESAVLRGQKTGFFLDQRENRARVGDMAAGRDVLNVFSFSGGFSVYAARGGARSVTDVDISVHALESAARNFALNPGLVGVTHRAVQADAFAWMAETREAWDLIVVDPPSLTRREREKPGALRAYRRLNADAMRCLRPGGILVAASCSAHVKPAEFLGLIRDEARRTGRDWRELWVTGHAPDHPAGFSEAEYLKAIALEFR